MWRRLRLSRVITRHEEPMFASGALDSCRASVVVPVRNEANCLARCLLALARQRERNGSVVPHETYEVLVLFNNCTDASYSVALEIQERIPSFQLHLCQRELDPEIAHAGTARGMLMDEAYHRLSGAEDGEKLILSTDADSRVAQNWLFENLRDLADGCDAVGGSIELDEEECAKLSPPVRNAYLKDRVYQRLTAKLEGMLDPLPYDPWPRHNQHFGASLGCTVWAYGLSGGLPRVKPLEDLAFYHAIEAAGLKFRHSPLVKVHTSARFDGRAEVGLAWQLRTWSDPDNDDGKWRVASADYLNHIFRLRGRLREVWLDYETDREVSMEKLESLASQSNCPATLLEGLIQSRLGFQHFLRGLRFPESQDMVVLDLERMQDTNAAIERLKQLTRRSRGSRQLSRIGQTVITEI